ncbi:MAG: SurA N-terminal domain-containing protein [Gammaproteobacteria bacterium]|nr:SurA N-terminal domain-containing protein [Gammaproteobacteria bacterium]
MLQTIRDHAQGVIVWTIVGLIIITFALFGLSSYLSGSSKTYVANINGVEIDESEYRRAMQDYRSRLQQMMGNSYRDDMFNSQMIKQEVVNGLITRELITQYLEDQNFKVGPTRVAAEIKSIDAFKDESGQFSKARYFELINRQGMSETFFEQQLARDVASRFVQMGIRQSDFATESEARQFLQLKNQQRDIGYLSIAKKSYLKKARASKKQIEEYYNAHKREFMNPEKISIEYIEIDLQKLAAGYDVSDEEVKQFYTANQESYVSQAEQRKVSHILIKVDDKIDEKSALKKIKSIQTKLKKGNSFSKLAKEFSQDPGSAKQGGDLGFFGKGVMDKAFEASAFSLKKGKVSKPVRSAFGYHLIKLEDIRAAKVQTFDKVKAQIRKDLQIQRAEQTFYELSEKLNNITYEQPGSLQPVVDELGLKIQKTGLFDRSVTKGIVSKSKVLDAAFSDDVLNLGRNSDLIELSDTHLMVLRKLEHQQASQKSLEAVRKQIIEKLRQKVAQENLNEQLEKAYQELQKGTSPKKLAKKINGAKWERVGYISRTADPKDKKASKLSLHIRNKAFGLAQSTDKTPSWGKLTLSNGDAAVIGLYKVKVSDAQIPAVTDKQQLAQNTGSVLFSRLLEQQRLEANIEINLPSSDE